MNKWKSIEGYPNYIVSDTGEIRNINSISSHSIRDKKGYFVTDLYKDGKRKTARVHRLVAEAFIPNPENKSEVNHLNGNKKDNRVSNLEWTTKKENMSHAVSNGLTSHIPSYGMLGKKNPNGGRKGKPFRIIETGEIFGTLAECEKAINGNDTCIQDCLKGRQHTHRGYHFEYIS